MRRRLTSLEALRLKDRCHRFFWLSRNGAFEGSSKDVFIFEVYFEVVGGVQAYIYIYISWKTLVSEVRWHRAPQMSFGRKKVH